MVSMLPLLFPLFLLSLYIFIRLRPDAEAGFKASARGYDLFIYFLVIAWNVGLIVFMRERETREIAQVWDILTVVYSLATTIAILIFGLVLRNGILFRK